MHRRPARSSFRFRFRQRSIALFLVTLLLIGGWDFVAGRSGWAQSGGASSPLEWPAEAQELKEAVHLNQQVLQLYQQGRYADAIPLAQQALEVRERILGADHLDVAQSLNNLAELYRKQGNYAQAEPLYQRSLSIRERVLEADHPDVAQSLNNLATLYQDQGNYAQAEPLYQRSLSIREAVLGANHPDVATSLNNLAELYRKQGNYAQAEPLYQRSLSIREAALGVDHPLVAQTDVAQSLSNLATLYQDQGSYAQAEPLYQRSLSIREAALGADHPDVATSLNNLALLYKDQGNYAQAKLLYQRSLSIREAALGVDHPLVAVILNNLAVLSWAEGDLTRALEEMNRGNQIEETNLALTLAVGSEARKRAYIATLQGSTDSAISLHLQAAPTHTEAARLALTTVLRRKGRVLEAMTNTMQTLLQNLTPLDRQLLNQLNNTRSQLATLIYGGLESRSPEQHRTEITELQAQAEQLENQLAQRSAEFESEPATIEAIQQLIPADAALVELVQYEPFNPRASFAEQWGNPRYAAYVLNKTGDPQGIDLGEAESIDQLITQFRSNLRTPTSGNRVRQAGRELDAIVMQPIRSLLGDKTHILISPDGQLNLIPFAALVDEGDHYLLDSYNFTYLTSGRDLLKLQLDNPSRQAPVLFANPDYENPGDVQVASIDRGSSQRSIDLTELQFAALPGTQTEADAIAPLLPNVTVLTGAQATENTLKRLQSPSILHLATHGFFLEDVEFVPPNSRGDGTIVALPTGDREALPEGYRPAPNPNRRQSNENPLLRSGLALAGFNPRQGGGAEDGVLTALEVTNLDLRGTELVVMSACETGIGDVINGEGVYGLRRAFVMAGAESQLMSLWKVDDYATSELMSLYYQRLQQGEDRSQALRQVQRSMLEAPAYRHPYFWSGFIFSGDWSAIDAVE